LVSIGLTSEPVISGLTGRLKDDHWEVREAAVQALSQLDSDRDRLVRVLNALMDDESIRVRHAAAATLLKTNNQVHTYVAVLVDWLKEPDAGQRWLRIDELAKYVSGDDRALPAIASALSDENERVRAKAAMTLGSLGSAARSTESALREALKDEFVNVRETAAEALKKISAEGAQ
jgi:HEAT repeat protein